MKKTVVALVIILIIVVLVGIIKINTNNDITEYKNTLSKEDTFQMFIKLIEDANYEEAKKYTASSFNSDLSSIRSYQISKKNKNTELSSENIFIFTEKKEIGYYNTTINYYFELQETKNGWKILNFYDEYSDNSEEINNLIY